ncbi:MAG: glycosyltransferase family 4 protein [Solirubrobacteraceae bacterium]
MRGSPTPLRLGYACAWWHPREQTWSYSAVRLRQALAAHATVLDIEAQRSLAGKAILRALCLPQRELPWQYCQTERRLIDRAVRRGVSRALPEAVLGIGEVDTVSEAPTFFYQDTSAAAILAYQAESGLPYTNLLPCRRDVLERWAAQQGERDGRAAAVFTMSRWYRDFLVGTFRIPPERIVVIPPGVNNPPTVYRDPERPSAGRVLFVGTDFAVKAGDVVVEAVRRLRRGGDGDVRLTVVGPDRWPLPGKLPDFVDFRGPLPAAEVSALYAVHDVLAMPSRYEGFGIVLAEALVAGLPCVARRAFAMPEIVEEGITGALVDSEDADELAVALASLLGDPEIFSRVAAARVELSSRFDWNTAARLMVEHMTHVVRGD